MKEANPDTAPLTEGDARTKDHAGKCHPPFGLPTRLPHQGRVGAEHGVIRQENADGFQGAVHLERRLVAACVGGRGRIFNGYAESGIHL
ncbi:MAG: hypothetical protein ACK535_15665 [Cyanobacteriota bacterium]|jgi:hypothetical protein